MTLEELWKLFPITLVPYNPLWPEWAAQEICSLNRLLRDYNPVINHIGSTAIPGIKSKPVIDILVETRSAEFWNNIEDLLISKGYICMSRNVDKMSFNKGYTIDGYADKVFHIHFHILGDNDEILFRDYLNKNLNVAKEYESLKLSLLKEYQNNRDAYTEAKSDFIRGVIEKACHSTPE